MPIKITAIEFRRAFGQQLQTVRINRQLTQTELARVTDVSLNTIGSIERGVRFPSCELMLALAKALDLDVRDLFPPTKIWRPRGQLGQ